MKPGMPAGSLPDERDLVTNVGTPPGPSAAAAIRSWQLPSVVQCRRPSGGAADGRRVMAYIDYANLVIVLAIITVIVGTWRFLWRRFL